MNYIKKISAIIMIGIIAFSLAACSKGSAVGTSETTGNAEELFIGTVISISEDGIMLVLPEELSEAANSSDRFNISVEYLLDSSSEPAVGDVIEVFYNGIIEEQYPAQLAGITSVEVIMSNADYTVVRAYTENDDGTYECDGYTYNYKHEILGRMPNSNDDKKLVYLSNLDNSAFTQAWDDTAGFSGDYDNYFNAEDAVLVEIIHSGLL